MEEQPNERISALNTAICFQSQIAVQLPSLGLIHKSISGRKSSFGRTPRLAARLLQVVLLTILCAPALLRGAEVPSIYLRGPDPPPIVDQSQGADQLAATNQPSFVEPPPLVSESPKMDAATRERNQ